MLISDPLLIITPEYENSDKIIEGEDTIDANQVVFIIGDVIINDQFTVLGQMVII